MKGLNRRNVAANIRTANRGSVGDAALNTDTRNWLSLVRVAGSNALYHNKFKVHNFVERNYGIGLRDITGTNHLIRYFLPINKSTSLQGSVVPLWAPSGVGSAVLTNFVDNDWSENGLLGDGSTKYGNTGFNPNTHLSSIDDCSLFAWVQNASTVTTDVALLTTRTAASDRFNLRSDGLGFYSDVGTLNYAIIDNISGSNSGLWVANRSSSTNLESIFYAINGITKITGTNTTANTGASSPDRAVKFAVTDNNGVLSEYNGRHRFRMIGIGRSLTATQADQLYSLTRYLNGDFATRAPVVVGTPATGVSSTSDSTSYSANLPSGIVAGELLLLVVSSDGSPTLTAPTGWAKVGQASNSTVVTGAVFWKIADGTEGSTITISSTASEQYSSISYRIANAVFCSGSSANGSSTNSNPPSHAPSSGAQNYLWIATRSGDSTVVATVAPTDFTDLQTRAGGGTSGSSTNTAIRSLNASNLDPGTFTSATEQWVCWTLAVI